MRLFIETLGLLCLLLAVGLVVARAMFPMRFKAHLRDFLRICLYTPSRMVYTAQSGFKDGFSRQELVAEVRRLHTKWGMKLETRFGRKVWERYYARALAIALEKFIGNL